MGRATNKFPILPVLVITIVIIGVTTFLIATRRTEDITPLPTDIFPRSFESFLVSLLRFPQDTNISPNDTVRIRAFCTFSGEIGIVSHRVEFPIQGWAVEVSDTIFIYPDEDKCLELL